MKYVCLGDVMDVLFSIRIVRCGAAGVRVLEVCVFRQADLVCLCVSCGSPQCCVLHDLQFVNAGRGSKRQTPEAVS